MLKIKRSFWFLFLLIVSSNLAFSWSTQWFSIKPMSTGVGKNMWLTKELHLLKNQASNIDDKVLRLSLEAYLHAKQAGLNPKQLLTIIDYSKPATERRLWVFDLKNNRALFNTWVSHGKNSGTLTANSFSNRPGSLKSSIGVFLTDQPYFGNNGYSLRLKGLERGINDNAFRRHVVIHGAWYVGSKTLQKYGKIGRSWGCPAVSERTSKLLIDKIKEHTLLIAYYPDANWLAHSSFLKGPLKA